MSYQGTDFGIPLHIIMALKEGLQSCPLVEHSLNTGELPEPPGGTVPQELEGVRVGEVHKSFIQLTPLQLKERDSKVLNW